MIDNVIFDFGNVIINVDTNHTEKKFAKIGVKNFSEFYSLSRQSNLFTLLETGKITPEEFRTDLRKMLKINIKDDEIDNAWNAMLLDIPEERLATIIKLKANKNKKVYLLSNTNEIHINYFLNNQKELWQISDFKEYFDDIFLSYEIGYRKPQKEIYNHLINKTGIDIKKTLFIDDNKDNIMTANDIGMKTYLFNKETETLNTVLKKYNLL